MNKKKLLSVLLVLAMVLSLAACGGAKDDADKGVTGTYEGKAKGHNGDLVLEVSFKDSKIEKIDVKASEESEGIGDKAIEKLSKEVIDNNTVDVDTVATATVTSNAFLEAVKDAIKNAGLKEEDFAKADDADKEDDKTSEEKELEADVVVVGAGGAGMTAAIEANDAGKSVIILEKADFTGGNTTRATGGMNAGKTEYQDKNEFEANDKEAIENKIKTAREEYPELKELADTVEGQLKDYEANPEGYFDSKELFMLDTLVGGKNINNKELVETLVDNSSAAIDWLKSYGMELTDVGSFGGASVKRIHRPLVDGQTKAVGSYLVPKMTEILEEKKVDILFGTAATELIEKDGAIVGVKAGDLTVNAKSVVLATGGFAANLEKVAEIKPELKGFVTTNAATLMGDGIWMAEKVGADVVDMDQIQIHPTVEQETSSLITEGVRGDGAILVNQDGKRFIDEVGTRDVVSAAEIEQPGSYAYLIFDQAMVEKSGPLQGYIEKGFTKQGETYEELAKELEIDEKTLAETMENWNKAVLAKKDEEFGRTAFADELKTAPYYAIKLSPGVHHTMGGLKINTNTEVLDKDGNAIPNLYAAGEITGGVHGANRLGGNAVADIIIYGRIAGQNAAKNVK